MIKKSALFLGLTAAIYLHAQDVSVIRNTAEIYSNSNDLGTARYNAMAGSMGALGGDISSINTNPAALGVFITGDVSGTLNIHNSTNTSSLAGRSISYDVNKTDLGQAGAVMVFENSNRNSWKFINVGVNYSNKTIEDYIETPGNANIKLISQPDNISRDYAGHAYNRYGNRSTLNISLAGNYENKFYIGGNLNFHSANIDQSDTALFTGVNYNFSKQFTPFSENSNGFSASFGVIGKVNNQFRLGASLETPIFWKIERLYNEYGYKNNLVTQTRYNEDRTLTSPMKATISGAFVANKNFAINVDYTLGLSKPKYKVQGDAEKELNTFFNDNYNNLSELKIGGEYRLDAFRIRAGYGVLNNPFKDITATAFNNSGAVSDVAYSNFLLGKRNTIGAGVGYNFKSFYVDLAYQNVTSEYYNPFLRGFEFTNNAGEVTFATGYFGDAVDVTNSVSAVSHVKNKMNNIYLTAGWKF